MIRPPPGVWAFIIRTACWAHRKAPVRLVSTTCLQSAQEISSTAPAGPNTPALLTSRSTLPHRRCTAANSPATDPGTVTSAGTASADSAGQAPDARLSRRAGSRRPAAATCHPAESKARAMHRPSPDPAPVTTATPVVAISVPSGSCPLRLLSPPAAVLSGRYPSWRASMRGLGEMQVDDGGEVRVGHEAEPGRPLAAEPGGPAHHYCGHSRVGHPVDQPPRRGPGHPLHRGHHVGDRDRERREVDRAAAAPGFVG